MRNKPLVLTAAALLIALVGVLASAVLDIIIEAISNG